MTARIVLFVCGGVVASLFWMFIPDVGGFYYRKQVDIILMQTQMALQNGSYKELSQIYKRDYKSPDSLNGLEEELIRLNMQKIYTTEQSGSPNPSHAGTSAAEQPRVPGVPGR